MANIMRQFSQFKNNFRGNPEQCVQDLLNSGKMSQEQFNTLYQIASQLKQFIK